MHRKAMNYFRQYLIVGGMPQAVKEFVESRDFDEVDRVKRDILTLYRADMMKHAQGYEIKPGKFISFRAPGQERFTRCKTLGEAYTEEAIKEEL